MNELFLIITLLVSFGGTILFLKIFGKGGLFALFVIAIALSIALCELFMRLERRRYFGWLRFSH